MNAQKRHADAMVACCSEPDMSPVHPRPRALGCDCGRPRYRTEDLFPDGCDELCIDHGGEKYTLRITRQNKLILNK